MSEPQRKASTVSSMERRTCWPSPVRLRASSAAQTAWAMAKPVSLSGRMVRTRRGRSVSAPACTVVRPLSDWISGSKTGLSAKGPSKPKPAMET